MFLALSAVSSLALAKKKYKKETWDRKETKRSCYLLLQFKFLTRSKELFTWGPVMFSLGKRDFNTAKGDKEVLQKWKKKNFNIVT